MLDPRYDYHDAYTRGIAEGNMTNDGLKGHADNPYSNTDRRRMEWQRGFDSTQKTGQHK